MGGDGFVHPLTDRAEMIICLALKMGIVGMAQAQDKERMKQQVEAERRYRKGSQMPGLV
jgi:hypothetical protein